MTGMDWLRRMTQAFEEGVAAWTAELKARSKRDYKAIYDLGYEDGREAVLVELGLSTSEVVTRPT